MDTIEIGQKRKWNNYDDRFIVVDKEVYPTIELWVLQYESDGRKQSQTEDTILNKSVLIYEK